MAFQPEGVAPCCQYELSELEKFSNGQQQFSIVKEQFLNDIIPTGCKKCELAFQQNRQGYYQHFNHYQTDFTSTEIQEINVKSNNFCNLACRSCGPHFSSKWEEEFNKSIKITKDDSIFDKINLVDFTKLKHIRFAGGEPTLTGDHVTILHKLIDTNNTNIDIVLATNLHTLKYKDVDLIELWQQFSNLQLHISIDAIEENAKTIRSGTNWDLVNKNLKKVVDSNISYFITITVSALNIWFLEDTTTYLQNTFKNINIRYSILTNPDILNLHVIPNRYRDDLNKMLDRCIVINRRATEIKTYFNLATTDELWPHFLIYNLMLDATRQETFFNNLPIKHDLIDTWIKL